MQIMDFIIELRIKLAIITNRSNLADLDKAKKMAKNMKNANLINKNMIAISTALAVTEVKKLKVQILKLKVKLKESKYILREDHKTL